MSGLLEARAVRKTYGAHDVLKGVDLSVATHRVVCLIGASGSGKSTLLRCLNLLEVVDDGEVWFDGREITDPRIDVDGVRRDIGIVFQAYNLFPHMSVLDNVTLGPRKTRGVRRREADERAMTLLTRFGLADQARKHPDALSGGQQQRVAIVRALAMGPKVLLLDEVTSALDPMLVGEVLEAVRGLKEAGMTIVMATHEMQFAREVADEVLFLDDGVVRERGTAEQLFTAPTDPRTREFLARHLA
ncbi:amino acid ABC transporter ATP-binding protein [Mumia sp. ZJ1417]|uniref:amino acid ABC transporter ATP-binding protein n=1 Tax=unclassified Mumia TaxID=2621872 RepID=UPI0014203FAE|nr:MULTISPECIES: amino acid ABC transporter ATP-binding protein [unclassified Mumia]QMW66629.1 amino acid ABC transporter ATP-binding protein [Mumia sp. ZJ1417]